MSPFDSEPMIPIATIALSRVVSGIFNVEKISRP